jgi:Holliday junction DNA helicase RuvA
MYDYIKGIVKEIKATYIVLDNNNIGYKVHTPNPYAFKEAEEYVIYIYEHVREDELSLYGFKSTEEKDLFLKLIDVKGLGPKTALPMLATGSVSGIIDAIERENILYLKKFPKIGDKVAKQIILDLKGKLATSRENITETIDDELVDVLKGLGYKIQDINKVICKIDRSTPIEEQIKASLKLFLK